MAGLSRSIRLPRLPVSQNCRIPNGAAYGRKLSKGGRQAASAKRVSSQRRATVYGKACEIAPCVSFLASHLFYALHFFPFTFIFLRSIIADLAAPVHSFEPVSSTRPGLACVTSSMQVLSAALIGAASSIHASQPTHLCRPFQYRQNW